MQNWHNCESGGKLITQTGNSKVHIQTHSGQKPHNCKQCSKSWSQAGSLKKHLQIHSIAVKGLMLASSMEGVSANLDV